MTEVKIGGAIHPLYFSMLSIEQVLAELKVEDFSELGKVMDSQSVAKSIKFGRVCALAGIQSGYRKLGEKCPFVTSDDLAEAVEHFVELEPAILAFSAAVQQFFKPADDVAPVTGK